MNRYYWITAGITGAIIFFFYLLYFFTFYWLEIGIFDSYDFWIPIFFLWLGMRYFRDMYQNGKLTLFQGASLGMMSTLIAAVLYASFVYMFLERISPEAFQENLQVDKTFLMENKDKIITEYGKERYEERLMMNQEESAGGFAIRKFLFILGLGFLYSFILGILLKRNGST
jgi:hypothetical protein